MANKVNNDTFKRLKKLTPARRIQIADSPVGQSMLGLLTPSQLADAFPKYWEKALPDVGGFQAAISKKSQSQQQGILDSITSQISELKESVGEKYQKVKSTIKRKGAELKEDVSEILTGGSKVPVLNKDADVAWNDIQKGPIDVNSPGGKIFSRLSDKKLSELGITKSQDKDGKTTYNYNAPTAGKEEIESRIKGDYKKGTEGLAGKKALQKMVYDGYKNAGFSDSQARALTAEVGRENGYNAATLFGTHIDPYNKEVNLGMISMQGSRGKGLYNYLQSKDLIDKNGNMKISQETVNAMAAYQRKEMQEGTHGGSPEQIKRVREFLNNPNIDKDSAAEILGKDYIRWRYNDPRYASGHRNRDDAYAQLDQTLGQMKQSGGGDVNKLSKEEYESLSQKIISEKSEQRKADYARAMFQYEKDNGLQHSEETASVATKPATGGYQIGPTGHIQPTDPTLYDSKNSQQCATLSKAFNKDIGRASGWKVERNDAAIKPGVVVATSMYNQGSGKEGSGYHTGVALTKPDKDGNFYMLDQFNPNANSSGKPAIRQYNINGYKQNGNYFGIINGRTESSLDALKYVKSIAGKDHPALQQIDEQISALENAKNGSQIAKTDATEVKNVTGDTPITPSPKEQTADVNGPRPAQPKTEVKPTAEVEKKSLPNKYKVDRAGFIDAIKQTPDFKNNPLSFMASEDMIIDGFNKDSQVVAAGVKYDAAKGVMTFKDPSHPGVQQVMKDLHTDKFMTPIQEPKPKPPVVTPPAPIVTAAPTSTTPTPNAPAPTPEAKAPTPTPTSAEPPTIKRFEKGDGWASVKEVPNPAYKPPAPTQATPEPPKPTPTPPPPAQAPTTTPAQTKTTVPPVPGASDGGSFDVRNAGDVNFYPMDKKDNVAAVDTKTQKPLFTAKSGEKIDVTPSQKVQGNNVGPTGNNVKTEFDALSQQIGTAFNSAGKPQQPSMTMQQRPSERVDDPNFGYNLQKQNLSKPYHNAAFERAMMRTRLQETGDTLNGHFSNGNTNY